MRRPVPWIVAAGLVTAAGFVHAQERGITGAWRYNPELSTPLPQAAPDGQRPRGGGPGGGRPPGGGRGGGMPGMPGMGKGPSQDDLRRMGVIRRRVTEPPASLVIVRDGGRVIVTDGDGRSVTYQTDGRKEERVTGDGEFTSRAHWEDEGLVVEEDFGGGVKLTTRAAPIVSEERERLEVTMTAAGLPKPPDRGGRPPEDDERRPRRGPIDHVVRVYERAER